MADKARLSTDEIRSRVSSVGWFHDWEIAPGVRTGGQSSMKRKAHFHIPSDLRGKRVLDVGCADGYFTFLAEARGAEVVAIDCWPRKSFFVACEILDSKAEFHHINVYDASAERLGLFDIVFLFGVYYHLKNPMLALERVASVTREFALIESEVWLSAPGQEAPPEGNAPDIVTSRFIVDDRYANDPSNWWIPSVPCFAQTIQAAGFPQANVLSCYDGHRCVVKAVKGPRTAAKALTEDIFIVIEQPAKEAPIEGATDIEGWIVSQLYPADGIHHVWLYLDHLDDPESELGEAEYGLPNPGLGFYFYQDSGASKFRFHWDPSGVRPGPHTLHVLVDGRCGWNYRSVPVLVGQKRPIVAQPVETAQEEKLQPPPSFPEPDSGLRLAALADQIEASSDVAVRDYTVRSRVPLVGPLIAWARRNATSHLREPYLDPMIDRQVGLNQKVAEWLKRASGILAAAEQRRSELEASLQAVEARNADLEARVAILEKSE